MALAATLFIGLCITARLVRCQTTSTNPSFLPIAVRSPYFNSWMATHSSNGLTSCPAGCWPTSWAGRLLGWGNFVRVDGQSYQWQGNEANFNLTNAIASYVTPTRTIFTVAAGPVHLNATYLSPVEPSNWVLQSFPFSYLSIDVWSADGNQHDIQLYSDVTGEWTSNSDNVIVEWGAIETSRSQIHYMHTRDFSPFAEISDFAPDGTLYFAMPRNITPNISWQSGGSTTLRNQFTESGRLNDFEDTDFRPIHGADYPVTAFAVNLGTILQTSNPIVFELGYVREPVIQVVTPLGTEERSSYFWTKYTKIEDAIDDFGSDFSAATDRAISLDNDLRPAFAAMDNTVSRLSSKQLNASDVKAYMKDLGTSGRINAVETLYANLPAILYLNSTLARVLLEPLLDFQDSSLYGNGYAAPDLGTTYPDVKGNTTDQSSLSFENCGSMLVMAMSYTQKSGDGSLLQRYYKLLKSWADYLIANNLVQPSNFLTADGLAVSSSNLALKSITGIQAMSTINHILEPLGASSNKTQFYASTVESAILSWRNLAFTADHVTATYQVAWSWNTLYNVYASKLINVSLIDPSIMTTEASWYTTKAATADRFGFGFDSSQNLTRADWLVFAAASIPSTSVRDSLISMVHTRAFWNASTTPWPIFYKSDDGTTVSGTASPALGAMYALLAASMLDKPIQIDTTRSVGNTPSSADGHHSVGHKTDVAAITGAAVGGVVLLLLLAGIALWRRQRSQRHSMVIIEPFPKNPDSSTAPLSSKAALHAASRLYGHPTSSSSNTDPMTSSESIRHEVAQLRQEVVALRMGVEPPPTYTMEIPSDRPQ